MSYIQKKKFIFIFLQYTYIVQLWLLESRLGG